MFFTVRSTVQNYSADFHKVQWNGPWKKPLDFNANPDHIILGLRLQFGGIRPYSTLKDVLSDICLTVTICDISDLSGGVHSTECHSCTVNHCCIIVSSLLLFTRCLTSFIMTLKSQYYIKCPLMP